MFFVWSGLVRQLIDRVEDHLEFVPSRSWQGLNKQYMEDNKCMGNFVNAVFLILVYMAKSVPNLLAGFQCTACSLACLTCGIRKFPRLADEICKR